MISPIITVQTICDELKYGANNLEHESSTAITVIPDRKEVM
jgi:hypothetical protein